MSYKISGRIVIEERGSALPNVLVRAYWVKKSETKANLKKPIEKLLQGGTITQAGTSKSNISGRFMLEVDPKGKLGKIPSILFTVSSPTIDGRRFIQKLLYRSSAPVEIGQTEYVELKVNSSSFKDTPINPKRLSSLDKLNKAEERRNEISTWHKGIVEKKREKLESLRKTSKEAFKNFRPSRIPKHLKKEINYLEEKNPVKRKNLSKKIYQKAFDALVAKNKGEKVRTVSMGERGLIHLGLTDQQEIKISWTDFVEALDNQKEFQLDWKEEDSALTRGLDAIKRRRDSEQEIVNQLFAFIQQEL